MALKRLGPADEHGDTLHQNVDRSIVIRWQVEEFRRRWYIGTVRRTLLETKARSNKAPAASYTILPSRLMARTPNEGNITQPFQDAELVDLRAWRP